MKKSKNQIELKRAIETFELMTPSVEIVIECVHKEMENLEENMDDLLNQAKERGDKTVIKVVEDTIKIIEDEGSRQALGAFSTKIVMSILETLLKSYKHIEKHDITPEHFNR